jgi:hypothetical protein
MGIYSGLIFLILLGRAAFVFPLSALANYMNRRSEQTPSITFQHQVTEHVLYDILLVLKLYDKIFFHGILSLVNDSDNYLVGGANERSSFDCFGFQTCMCMKFSFLDIVTKP